MERKQCPACNTYFDGYHDSTCQHGDTQEETEEEEQEEETDNVTTVFTGWKTVTPGKCFECGESNQWHCDGRGNILCGCQRCPDCGLLDAYNFHETNCPRLIEEEEDNAE